MKNYLTQIFNKCFYEVNNQNSFVKLEDGREILKVQQSVEFEQ